VIFQTSGRKRLLCYRRVRPPRLHIHVGLHHRHPSFSTHKPYPLTTLHHQLHQRHPSFSTHKPYPLTTIHHRLHHRHPFFSIHKPFHWCHPLTKLHRRTPIFLFIIQQLQFWEVCAGNWTSLHLVARLNSSTVCNRTFMHTSDCIIWTVINVVLTAYMPLAFMMSFLKILICNFFIHDFS